MTIELDSLVEWPAAVEVLVSALQSRQPLGETYVLLPLRAGRPVPSLAMSVIATPLPATNLDTWLPLLNEPHPSRLADTFSEGVAALQALSGICDLPESQRTHKDVEGAASAAVAEYQRSHGALLEAAVDPVTEELVNLLEELAEQVQSEVDGTHDGDTIASQVAAGLIQSATGAIFDSVVGARYLALEWDVDREVAVALLGSA